MAETPAQNDKGLGPEGQVWSYLYSGLDMAQNAFDEEFSAYLEPEVVALVNKLAKQVFDAKSGFVVGPDRREELGTQEALMKERWFKYAADMALAWEGISRASEALTRYLDVEPAISAYRLSNRAAQYLREVIHTYVFGFDAASIALCGAALDQVLQQLAVEAGEFTEAELIQQRPPASLLLKLMNSSRAIV